MPPAQPFTPSSGGPGPYLEGGDIICFQNHLFVGESDIASNRKGTRWLETYIQPFGYQVHPMPMKGSILHLLGTMVLIRKDFCCFTVMNSTVTCPMCCRTGKSSKLPNQGPRDYATVGVSLEFHVTSCHQGWTGWQRRWPGVAWNPSRSTMTR
ncbi:MAG: hypothetical protein CM1200mP20_13020 [Pseudomonadota bacterium]|nr:MAG: hypothetical protein CM1200mP20_13020 [Pseudomonadota bacterium]